MRHALWVGPVAASVAASIACSNGGGGPPSCEQALVHAYAMGCVLTSGGSAVSENDAINGCNQDASRISAGSCDCNAELGAGLSCMDSLGQGQCRDCSPQLAAFDSCMGSRCK
jgi:hypothetical protein